MNKLYLPVILIVFLNIISCTSVDKKMIETREEVFVNSLQVDSVFDSTHITSDKINHLKTDTFKILNSIMKSNYKGYSMLEYEIGDINRDSIDDLILVLEIECEEITGKNNRCRKTVLVESYELMNFNILIENDKIIECSQCGGAGVGDPFRGIEINDSTFTFHSLYGACEKTNEYSKFKYDIIDEEYYLIEFVSESYSCKINEGEDEIRIHREVKTKKDFGVVSF